MNYQLSKKEIKFIISLSLFLIVLTCLPFIYGYASQGDFVYTGLHKLVPVDGALYFSYLEQIRQGNWLLDILYTNETDYLQFFNLFWLVVGLVGKILHLNPALTFHLFRIILLPFFIYIVYKFIKLILPNLELRLKKVFLLYIIFSAGFGGYWSLIFPDKEFSPLNFDFPIDLFVPEANNFLILFYSPHFILSLSLIICIFYYFLRAIWEKKIIYSILAGVVGLFLFNFHPFYFITIYSIPLVYLVVICVSKRKIIWQYFLYYILLVSISLPSVSYYLYFLLTNENFQIKSAQNNSLSPLASYFFLSYGLNLILAILCQVYLIERKKVNKRIIFLFVWFWFGIVLIYGPFNFQRRLTEGWQIPLATLACLCLLIIWLYIKRQKIEIKKAYLYFLTGFFVVMLCFTNILFLYKDIKYLQRKSCYVYLTKDFSQALAWYKQQTNFSQTLLCSIQNSNIIPGQIARRVFLGHAVETINFNEKVTKLDWFFSNNQDDQQKIEFLKQAKIDYVLYTALEKKLGDYDPLAKEYLKLVYENDKVQIFQVNLIQPGQ